MSAIGEVFADELLPRDLGAGLVLDLQTVADAEESFAVVDAERDRLREWLPWVDANVSVQVTRDYFQSVELAHAAGTGVHATIRLDGTFCGVVGLRLSPVHSTAELGYWLSAAATGRGVMTRSAAGMIDVAFGDFGLHRVELLAALGNTRSRSVAERLGMTYEGTLREAENLAQGYVDLAVYGLLAHEWTSRAVPVTEDKRNH